MRYFQFRRGLKKMARRNPANAALISQALANEDVCAEACAWAEEQMESNSAGKWQDFLQWMMDHQEQIIAFIKAIIDMFMAPATT